MVARTLADCFLEQTSLEIPAGNTGLCAELADDLWKFLATEAQIDIGRRSPAVPVTAPYVRVRIRRFGGLSYRQAVKGGIPSEAK